MLRLPAFELLRPTTLEEALDMLAEHGDGAVPLAGGTDLLPNMKHRLLEPEVVVSLAGIDELRGIESAAGGGLRIGATTTLARIAADEGVRQAAPALAQAAGLVAGPQIRRQATLGGNVLLDTRCQWYNQTYFWRQALGFCLKKDGTVCHVVEGGSRCVAAASNDTAPPLMTRGAVLEIAGPSGRREVVLDEWWVNDGIRNHRLARGELLVAVRLPPPPAGHRGAYGKLRVRGSIDFPLLGVAVRVDLDEDGRVRAADLVATALQARPRRVAEASQALVGSAGEDLEEAIERAAAAAYRRLKPIENIPGDAEYRREMVPVLVRRTLRAALAGEGPVQL